MLFFAGTGCTIDNLWGSRKYFSHQEWFEVVVILLVFVFSDAAIPDLVAMMIVV